MHMGIFYLSNCSSNPGFPLYKVKACVVARQLCCRTHRLMLLRAVASSDKLSYWPAGTCSYPSKEPHSCYFIRFFYPVKNKHLNKLWPIWADQILNTIQQLVLMPVRDQWHIWQPLKHPAISLCYIYSQPHKKPHKQTNTRINSIMSNR